MHKTTTKILLLLSFFCTHPRTQCAANTAEDAVTQLRQIIVRNLTNQPITCSYKSAKTKTAYMVIAPDSAEKRYMYADAQGFTRVDFIESVESPIKLETVFVYPNFSLIAIEPTHSSEPKMTLHKKYYPPHDALRTPLPTD